MTDDAGGTYTLLIALPEPDAAAVGALGEIDLAAGWYAYTGSALGPGGFSRVERHRAVAAGRRSVRHWHVDYLLGRPGATIEWVRRSRGADIECAVAGAIEGDPVAGFGCSDCDCHSHLHYRPDRSALRASIECAHGQNEPPANR